MSRKAGASLRDEFVGNKVSVLSPQIVESFWPSRKIWE